jgi:hypothetical protein
MSSAKIGREYDSDFDGAHAMRLRASVSATCHDGGAEIPTSAAFDFHGTDDVAITGTDWQRLDLLADLAAELVAAGGPDAAMPVLDTADVWWPGFKAWLLGLDDHDRVGLLQVIVTAGGPGARRLG